MVVIRVELFEKSNAAPASTENDQLGLVLLSLLFRRIIIVDKMFSNGQVLGTSSSWVQGEFRNNNIDRVGFFLVCGGIESEEGDNEHTRNDNEDAEEGEASIQESKETRSLDGRGGRRLWRRLGVCALATDVVQLANDCGSCNGRWRRHALE